MSHQTIQNGLRRLPKQGLSYSILTTVKVHFGCLDPIFDYIAVRGTAAIRDAVDPSPGLALHGYEMVSMAN